jgi:hypothetical protein
MAKCIEEHMTNCSLLLGMFSPRNRMGVESDLHVWSHQVLCNSMEEDVWIWSLLPWQWRDERKCSASSTRSSLDCYFPSAELLCNNDDVVVNDGDALNEISSPYDVKCPSILTEIWENWLPRELRGHSSCVGCNVEIPVSRIFGITDYQRPCRNLCREFVSTREFCEVKQLPQFVGFEPSLAKWRWASTVSQSPCTKPLKAIEGLRQTKQVQWCVDDWAKRPTYTQQRYYWLIFDCENNLQILTCSYKYACSPAHSVLGCTYANGSLPSRYKDACRYARLCRTTGVS